MLARRVSRVVFALLVTSHSVWTIELNTEETLQDAVKKDPEDPHARMKLAHWYLKWGQLRKAIDELKTAAARIPKHAWEFREALGDLYYQWAQDERAAKTEYKEALRLNPMARRSILQYGMLLVWHNQREEADKLFQDAVKANLLVNQWQRPLEVTRTSKSVTHVPLYNTTLLSSVKSLIEIFEDIREEYLKWAKTRPKDSELDKEALEPPFNRGRWKHFWIYRPQFERGIWRSSCSYKTPKTCRLLQSLNGTGSPGEKTTILRADFDVLGPRGEIRPHCHNTDSETLLILPLFLPRLGSQKAPRLRVAGDWHELQEGVPLLFDATFEHEESLSELPDAGTAQHDYVQELRGFYEERNMSDKIVGIPEIMEKWSGKEEKMMRELRKKYLPGWKGERVALRLLLRSSILRAAARAEKDTRDEL